MRLLYLRIGGCQWEGLEKSKIEKGIWGKNSFKKKFEIEFLKKCFLFCKKPFLSNY